MKIISGTHRGRRLIRPEGFEIRPTSARVREALFSILGDIEDVIVIDGFAGTGALGFEALSRGAKHVTFFDRSREALDIIQENIISFDFASSTRLIYGSIQANISSVKEPANLVFLDPPYDKDLLPAALESLLKSDTLASDALIVIEHSTKEVLKVPEEFEFDESREYGRTTLSFYYAPTL